MRYSGLMRCLGIDYGTKKVGIAISSGSLALPKSVLPNNVDLISTIGSYLADYDIDTLVIGKSVNLRGQDNKITKEIQDFIDDIKILISKKVNIHTIDERYTSKLANTLPSEGLTRGNIANKRAVPKKRKQADAQAAALILQTFLDKRANMS